MKFTRRHEARRKDVERGPAIGEPFPAVELPDQSGQLLDVLAARADRPALVLFDRSTLW